MKRLGLFFAGGIVGVAIFATIFAWLMWPALVFGKLSIEYGTWLFVNLFSILGILASAGGDKK